MPQVLAGNKSGEAIVIGGKDKEPVALHKGRIIYSYIGLTDLNRSPIKKLMAYILDGANLESGFNEKDNPDVGPVVESPTEYAPFGVDVLTESLLVDGSVFAVDATLIGDKVWGESGLQIQYDVDVVTSKLAYQEHRDKDQHKIVREYKKYSDFSTMITEPISKDESPALVIGDVNPGEDYWWVTDYKVLGDDRRDIVERMVVSDDLVFCFPNGQGLLYEVQRMFYRLEEIKETIQDLTTGSRLDIIIIGHIGDPNQVAEATAQGVRMINIQAQAGQVDVQRLGKSETVNQLSNEFVSLKADYIEAINVIQLADSTTMSGVSRRLYMSPMLKQVERTRDQLRDIYNAFEWSITFGKFTTQSVDDRVKEFDLISKGLELQVIDVEEANTKRANLL